MIKFTKMHGCGNDYIYINAFEYDIKNPSELALQMSPRHTSVGADGVVLICPSDVAHAKMRMWNADGTEGKMCGNAIRCVGKYLYDSGMVRDEQLTVETLSGIKTLTLSVKENAVSEVCVDMGRADFSPATIPVLLPGDEVVAREVCVGACKYRITCVSMGNPHCVIFTSDTDKADVFGIGRLFERDGMFPEGVNTEFVQVIDRHTLKMRVWERGSGETYACGTGACASVAAAYKNGCVDASEPVTVKLRGGELYISYTEQTVLMRGGAAKVYEGIWNDED